MRFSILFTIASFFFFFITSCGKETSCLIGGLNLGLTNLDSNLNDTIELKKYTKGSNFSNLEKTINLIYLDSLDSMNLIFGDSLILNGYEVNWHNSDMNNIGFLNANYDYELITKNHVYQFSNLEIIQKTKKCGGIFSLECPDCFSPVIKFKLNQEQKTIAENELFYLEN